MAIAVAVRKEILDAIAKIGRPATITQIEQKVSFERHTLSKYLIVLKREGLLDYEIIGRAKLWRVNAAPLKHIFESAPESLGFAEQLLITLLQKMPAGILIVDPLYRIEFLNEIMQEMYGDARGAALYRTMLGKENPIGLGRLRKVVENKMVYAEDEIMDTQGNTLEIRAVSVRKPDGEPLTVLIVEDVTHDRSVERAMRRSEQLYRSLIEASTDGIYLLDIEAKVQFVSPTLLSLLGYTEAEVRGKSAFAFIVEEHHAPVRQHMADLLAGKAVGTRKYFLIPKHRRKMHVEVNSSLARDEKKEPMGFIGYVKKLTK